MAHPRRKQRRIRRSSRGGSSRAAQSAHDRRLMVPLCLLAVLGLAVALRFGSCDAAIPQPSSHVDITQAPLALLRNRPPTSKASSCSASLCEYCQTARKKPLLPSGGRVSTGVRQELTDFTETTAHMLTSRGGKATVGSIGQNTPQQFERGRGRGKDSGTRSAFIQSSDCLRLPKTIGGEMVNGGSTSKNPVVKRTTSAERRTTTWRFPAEDLHPHAGDTPIRSTSVPPIACWSTRGAARRDNNSPAFLGSSRLCSDADTRRTTETVASAASGQEGSQCISTVAMRGARGDEGGDYGQKEETRVPLPGTPRPPLLITIGPQCSGKTTVLRSLATRARALREEEKKMEQDSTVSSVTSVTDVTIDDHPAVYHKIPLASLLNGHQLVGTVEDKMVRGRRLSERLAEPGCVETRLVALRLIGEISAEKFSLSVREIDGKMTPTALEALCAAVENVVADEVRISTETADVFVRESLFPVAVSSSQRRLKAAARDEQGIVAWGNTNTQVRDFRGALEQAELSGRPVRFVRWGHEIPSFNLEELSRRNVCRFASTGRYVETAAIEAALGRVERMYATTGGGNPIKLALAAGFDMDASGKVTTSQSSPPPHIPPKRRSSRGDTVRGDNANGLDNTRELREQRGWIGEEGGESGGAWAWNKDVGEQREKVERVGERRLSEGHGDTAMFELEKGYSGDSGGDDVWREEDTGGEGRGGGGGEGGDRNVDFRLPSWTAEDSRGSGHKLDFFMSEGAAARVPLRLAQEWRLQTGYGLTRWLTAAAGQTVNAAFSRGLAAEIKPPTVVFGSDWGRKREWRRTDYRESDIDPLMTSCRFFPPVNGTKTLRRTDEHESSADFAEMDLVRRIKSIRQRR